MKCLKCGHENVQGAKFCDKCGSNLVQGICPECGHKNRASAEFCQQCGSRLKGGSVESLTPIETIKKPGLPLAAIIALGAVGLFVLVGGLYFVITSLGSSSPSSSPNAQNSTTGETNYAKVIYTTNPVTVVEENTPVKMVFDWSAKTEEQVQAFIDNAEQEVKLNGTPVVAKTTYSIITPDKTKGGFKTQIETDVGILPAGNNEVKTTIRLKKQISNGTENFGTGTAHEKIEKEAKIFVKGQSAGGDNSQSSQGSCPSDTDITAGELMWDGDDPYLMITNKLGWEPYEEAPANPPIFSSGGYPWAKPICEIDPNDKTQMACSGLFDNPAPVKDKIGLYLPYPWSAHPDKFCIFEVLDLKIAEQAVCPPEEDIKAGEVYWQDGLAKIEMHNPHGWEPYTEMPENPPLFVVNDEKYTDLDCEVDHDDNKIMVCSGPGTRKTGGMGMLLTYPWQGSYCVQTFEKIEIKNICRAGTFYCVYTSECCSGNQSCTVNGCKEPHDDHDD